MKKILLTLSLIFLTSNILGMKLNVEQIKQLADTSMKALDTKVKYSLDIWPGEILITAKIPKELVETFKLREISLNLDKKTCKVMGVEFRYHPIGSKAFGSKFKMIAFKFPKKEKGKEVGEEHKALENLAKKMMEKPEVEKIMLKNPETANIIEKIIIERLRKRGKEQAELDKKERILDNKEKIKLLLEQLK